MVITNQKKCFTMIPNELYGTGLSALEIHILAKILEFERNGLQCYISNDHFAYLYGVSRNTIDSALKKLESKKLIQRDTKYINERGQKNKTRLLSIDKAGYSIFIQCNKVKNQYEDEYPYKDTEKPSPKTGTNLAQKLTEPSPEIEKSYPKNWAIKEKLKYKKHTIKKKSEIEDVADAPVRFAQGNFVAEADTSKKHNFKIDMEEMKDRINKLDLQELEGIIEDFTNGERYINIVKKYKIKYLNLDIIELIKDQIMFLQAEEESDIILNEYINDLNINMDYGIM